jgi:uncharacterized protein (TIGR02646 family)
MLAIPSTPCPDNAQTHLASLQAEINALITFEERVTLAERHWNNRTNNRAFDAVKTALQILRPNSYCCYCESDRTSAIEHIWPKAYYPDRAFVWENYLYACSKCNSEHKKAKWAIFCADTGVDYVEEISWHCQQEGRWIKNPPPQGDPVFLDLCQEDPQALIRLDLETFEFVPHTHAPREQVRVHYTIEILRLNDGFLPEAREHSFRAYRDKLRDYVALSVVERKLQVEQKAAAFQNVPQKTVWREMQRWHQRIPELDALFTQAPEALDW